MRPSIDAWTITGYAALLATLILCGPGVRSTRAEDLALPVVPIENGGPICSASDPIDESRQIAELMRELQAAAEARAAAGAEIPAVLDGRGYNYGPASDDFHAVVLQQIDQIRRERH